MMNKIKKIAQHIFGKTHILNSTDSNLTSNSRLLSYKDFDFIMHLYDSNLITEDIRKISFNILKNLSQQMNAISLSRPTIAPDEDGGMCISWENKKYHFSIEIKADETIEFYFEKIGTSGQSLFEYSKSSLIDFPRMIDLLKKAQ